MSEWLYWQLYVSPPANWLQLHHCPCHLWNPGFCFVSSLDTARGPCKRKFVLYCSIDVPLLPPLYSSSGSSLTITGL